MSAFNLQVFAAAHRPGSRGIFVLDDFNSYIPASDIDAATMTPSPSAKAKKLSDGNPMSGAYLNGDASDPQNLIYTDTLMDTPIEIDPTGRNVTFQLRSQITRKLNSYDWDVSNHTTTFADGPIVAWADYDPADKNMLTVILTLKRPLERSTDQYGIKYKGTNTGAFFYFPLAEDTVTKNPAPASAANVKQSGAVSSTWARLGLWAGLLASLVPVIF